jgi:MoaA/NifB/PqqE/SkfB family radical SAM enzyme
VTFCGGEPLLVREIASYARSFTACHKRTVLNTNGLLLRRLFAKSASHEHFPFDVVGISIDGSTEGVHRAMRGPRANLAEVLAAAAFVSALTRASLKVATVVSTVNRTDITNLAAMVRDHIKPDVWRLYQYSSRGLVNRGQHRHTLGAEEFAALVRNAAEIAHPVKVIPSSEEANAGCLIVNTRGDVLRPFRDGYQVLGNCLQQPIDAIFEESSAFVAMVAHNKRWLAALPWPARPGMPEANERSG